MSEMSAMLDRYACGNLPLGVLVMDVVGRVPDGSWAEVEAAYSAGQITDSAYQALYDAVSGRRPRP